VSTLSLLNTSTIAWNTGSLAFSTCNHEYSSHHCERRQTFPGFFECYFLYSYSFNWLVIYNIHPHLCCYLSFSCFCCMHVSYYARSQVGLCMSVFLYSAGIYYRHRADINVTKTVKLYNNCSRVCVVVVR